MNNGTAFTIHDVQQFERELLPKYFNTQKYASFTRALCSYGFDCVRTGRKPGIYSHPKFNRNDPEALSKIRRVKKTNNAKAALNNRASIPLKNNIHSSLRDGELSIMFPYLSGDRSQINEDGNASAVGQLYESLRSQIADRTRNALVRLPPGAQFVSPAESDNDSSSDQQSPSDPIPQSASAAAHSSPSRIAANFNNTSKQIDLNYSSILDDNVAPIALSLREGRVSEQEHKLHSKPPPAHLSSEQQQGHLQDQDDFDPIPFAPHTSLQNQVAADPHSAAEDDDEALFQRSMEPRSIQEMKKNPDDLNVFYNMLPIFPKPRYQALYDYSSPVALPFAFYYMDISTFGMYWSMFLIFGHTIQSLFTAYGPNTRDLVLSPKISLGKHLFMDILWVHSLFSAMILVPEYFGSSSVMLAIGFLSTNPPSLGMSLKSHYHHFHSQEGKQFIYGEWWIADLIKCVLLGYMVSVLIIYLGHYYSMALLKQIGVFLMNLTPLFTCESYRLLLSIPAILLEDQNTSSDKKRQ